MNQEPFDRVFNFFNPVAFRISLSEELIIAFIITFIGNTINPPEAKCLLDCLLISYADFTAIFSVNNEPNIFGC